MKLRELIYLKDLTLSLATKELKSKYKSTTLGFLWIIINPLLQMVVLSIVFSFILRIQVDNYPLFVFSGLLPWIFFSLSVQAGTSSLIANRDLIRKVPFPREILPISSVLAHLFIFALSLVLLIIFIVLIKGWFFKLLLLLPLIFLQTLFTIGISLFLSSLDVYYRDTSFIVQALLPVWFYLTPVIYPIKYIPSQFLFLYNLNPMVPIITSYQDILLNTNFLSFSAIGITTIETFFLLIIGIFIFRKRSSYYADWV